MTKLEQVMRSRIRAAVDHSTPANVPISLGESIDDLLADRNNRDGYNVGNLKYGSLRDALVRVSVMVDEMSKYPGIASAWTADGFPTIKRVLDNITNMMTLICTQITTGTAADFPNTRQALQEAFDAFTASFNGARTEYGTRKRTSASAQFDAPGVTTRAALARRVAYVTTIDLLIPFVGMYAVLDAIYNHRSAVVESIQEAAQLALIGSQNMLEVLRSDPPVVAAFSPLVYRLSTVSRPPAIITKLQEFVRSISDPTAVSRTLAAVAIPVGITFTKWISTVIGLTTEPAFQSLLHEDAMFQGTAAAVALTSAGWLGSRVVQAVRSTPIKHVQGSLLADTMSDNAFAYATSGDAETLALLKEDFPHVRDHRVFCTVLSRMERMASAETTGPDARQRFLQVSQLLRGQLQNRPCPPPKATPTTAPPQEQ